MRAPAHNKWTARKGALPLAEFVNPAVGDAFAKFGFSQSDLILHWADIAGANLAAVCRPQKLQWPAGSRKKPGEAKSGDKKASESAPQLATLILQVESHAALEVQYQASILLQRVNNFLGWRCVGKISLRQAPLPKSETARAKQPMRAEYLARAQDLTDNIGDAPLRAALIRLGAQVFAHSSAEAKNKSG